MAMNGVQSSPEKVKLCDDWIESNGGETLWLRHNKKSKYLSLSLCIGLQHLSYTGAGTFSTHHIEVQGEVYLLLCAKIHWIRKIIMGN